MTEEEAELHKEGRDFADRLAAKLGVPVRNYVVDEADGTDLYGQVAIRLDDARKIWPEEK